MKEALGLAPGRKRLKRLKKVTENGETKEKGQVTTRDLRQNYCRMVSLLFHRDRIIVIRSPAVSFLEGSPFLPQLFSNNKLKTKRRLDVAHQKSEPVI